MTRVDQFESVFWAAAKPVYEYHPLEISKVLIASDLEGAARDGFEAAVTRFIAVLSDVTWTSIGREEFQSAGELLELVDRQEIDLVVTYRHLHTESWRWPHSLGAYVDLLSQAARCPVLVVPHPQRGGEMPDSMRNTDSVMAITDHLSGDARLVDYAVRFTAPGGHLHLTHVEDEVTFDRYLGVISRIPAIDTESAREQIRERLLVEAKDYVKSCRAVLSAEAVDIDVHGTVSMGHRISEYQRLIEQYPVDLLVMNTKEDDQHAMHGMAHTLAVELHHIPLLML